jgi:hypothetical protein
LRANHFSLYATWNCTEMIHHRYLKSRKMLRWYQI